MKKKARDLSKGSFFTFFLNGGRERERETTERDNREQREQKERTEREREHWEREERENRERNWEMHKKEYIKWQSVPSPQGVKT